MTALLEQVTEVIRTHLVPASRKIVEQVGQVGLIMLGGKIIKLFLEIVVLAFFSLDKSHSATEKIVHEYISGSVGLASNTYDQIAIQGFLSFFCPACRLRLF